jgi:hypothetical protein
VPESSATVGHRDGRCKSRRRRVDATGQPRCDLLEQPAVAIRILERRKRAVASMLGISPADAHAPKQVRLVGTGVHTVGVVEHLADLDAATKQVFAGGLDVGDDQVQTLRGAGCGGGDIGAEDDRTSGGGVNWITRKPLPSSKSASRRHPSCPP